MDESEGQLKAELLASVFRSLQRKRPLLTHLNADTTWLLSIPVPRNLNSTSVNEICTNGSSGRHKRKTNGQIEVEYRETEETTKTFFHILVDPWLRGSQSDVAPFFSQQRHAVESAVQTVQEIEGVISEIEVLASSELLMSTSQTLDSSEIPSESPINAVIVSHEFTDHMHKETLLEISSSVPVFATAKAADIIQSWRHFEIVVKMPSFTSRDSDWRHMAVSPLPPWLGICRIAAEAREMLYYHSAVMIAFSSSADVDKRTKAEAVIYTPHGITVDDLKPISIAQPPVHTLALLHGLHDIRLGKGGQLNLGAHNGLKAQRLTHAKYWVGTHDEVKRGGGLVSWFLKRDVLTVKEALEKEMAGEGRGSEINFVDLANGESLVLE